MSRNQLSQLESIVDGDVDALVDTLFELKESPLVRVKEALEAAEVTVAKLLVARGNVPLAWLANVEIGVKDDYLLATFNKSDDLKAYATLAPNPEGGWELFASTHESFVSGGLSMNLEQKGAIAQVDVWPARGQALEQKGASSLFCEVLEREAANQKMVEYFKDGGAQRLKAVSYSLSRNKISGVSPVLANCDEALIHSVCLKRNHEASFAGMVVDKTAEFAVLTAGIFGVHCFIPLETFPAAEALVPGDAVALRVSSARGLRMQHIPAEQIREAVMLASSHDIKFEMSAVPALGETVADLNDAQVPRARNHLLRQFSDKEKVFQGGEPELKTVECSTTPFVRNGIDFIKLRKSWKPFEEKDVASMQKTLVSKGFGDKSALLAEALDDKLFGAKEVRVRDIGKGEAQLMAVFEGNGSYSVEVLHLKAGRAAPLTATQDGLLTVASAHANGEKLAQKPLMGRSDLGMGAGGVAIQVKEVVVKEAAPAEPSDDAWKAALQAGALTSGAGRPCATATTSMGR